MHFKEIVAIIGLSGSLVSGAALFEKRGINGCRSNNCLRDVAGTGRAAGPIEPRVTACSQYLGNPALPVPTYADKCDEAGQYSSACSCLVAALGDGTFPTPTSTDTEPTSTVDPGTTTDSEITTTTDTDTTSTDTAATTTTDTATDATDTATTTDGDTTTTTTDPTGTATDDPISTTTDDPTATTTDDGATTTTSNPVTTPTCPAVGSSCVAANYNSIDTPCGGAGCGAVCDIPQAGATSLTGTCGTCVAAGSVCRTANDCCDPTLGCGISLITGGVQLLGTLELGFYGYCGGLLGIGLGINL